MAAGTALAIGGGLLGAVSGAGGDEQTTSRNVAPPTAMERDLQAKGFDSYLKQLALQSDAEAGIAGGAGVQNAARGSLEQILGGGAFNLTPEEQAQITNIRNATVQAGTGDIQNFVNENLSGVSNLAGQRGVRGQALSELQGRSIGEGARQIANLSSQANLTAAQQAQSMPMARVGIQGGLANQNANFQETLRQQAIQNRQQMSNPALLNTLQAERMGTASQTTSTPGGIGAAIGGAMSGVGAGLGAAGSLAKANYYENLAGGGFVQDVRRDSAKFKKNAQEFQKGFNSGEDVSESFRNIRRALGFDDPKKMAGGGAVPVDSEENDTVPAMLSPGEIVIPKSFAHDPDLSTAFIKHLFKKQKEAKEA
jgi:hypothetical protein